MKSAESYLDQVETILGIKLEQGESYQWDYESTAEAERALADMRDTQEKLEQLRRELNADIKVIRDDYRDKMASAAAGSSAAMSLLGRKQKAGQMKADAKRQLRGKRNEELAPYNDVKGSLDQLIASLGKQATQAQKFVDSGQGAETEERAEPDKQETALATFYLATPPAGSQMKLKPMPYTALKPIEPPQEFVFDDVKPAAPELKQTGLRGMFSASRRKQAAEENRRLQTGYEEQLQAWSEAKGAAEISFAQDKDAYQDVLADWLERKKAFDTAEAERVRQLEEARLSDPGTMRALLGRRLDSLAWPPELDMAYASEYTIERGGNQVHLEVRLPAQDSWPNSQATSGRVTYAALVHAIAFRLVGELFYVLPAAKKIVISGFYEESGRSGRHDTNVFLISSKVTLANWIRIDFENLEQLDLLGCFASYETRRKITEEGRLLPIDRFRR